MNTFDTSSFPCWHNSLATQTHSLFKHAPFPSEPAVLDLVDTTDTRDGGPTPHRPTSHSQRTQWGRYVGEGAKLRLNSPEILMDLQWVEGCHAAPTRRCDIDALYANRQIRGAFPQRTTCLNSTIIKERKDRLALLTTGSVRIKPTTEWWVDFNATPVGKSRPGQVNNDVTSDRFEVPTCLATLFTGGLATRISGRVVCPARQSY